MIMMNARGYPSNRLNQEKESHIYDEIGDSHLVTIMETGVNKDHNI